jgi:hypothetical protein
MAGVSFMLLGTSAGLHAACGLRTPALNGLPKNRSKDTLLIRSLKNAFQTTNFYCFLLSIGFIALECIFKKYISVRNQTLLS